MGGELEEHCSCTSCRWFEARIYLAHFQEKKIGKVFFWISVF